jgi:hypothetical protein
MEPRRSNGGTQPDRGDAAQGDAPARVDDAGDDAAETEQADDSAPLQWSRAMVDAVRRVDQFVVRYLDVARCGVWTVSDDGERAICVDQFVRDGHVHRRDPDRDGPNAAALHRRLQSAGWLSAGADAPNAALLPPGWRCRCGAAASTSPPISVPSSPAPRAPGAPTNSASCARWATCCARCSR